MPPLDKLDLASQLEALCLLREKLVDAVADLGVHQEAALLPGKRARAQAFLLLAVDTTTAAQRQMQIHHGGTPGASAWPSACPPLPVVHDCSRCWLAPIMGGGIVSQIRRCLLELGTFREWWRKLSCIVVLESAL